MKRTKWTVYCFATLLSFSLPEALVAAEGVIRVPPGAIPDRYIVVFEDSVRRPELPAVANELARVHSGKVLTVWSSALHGCLLTMPAQRAESMSHDPRIRFVEQDARIALSAVIPTNVAPEQACDPAVSQCQTVAEDRLWNLDRIEQDSPVLNNRYGYCSTGTGVYIYVVDSGVMAQHSEFWASETDTSHPRVLDGYSAAQAVPNGPVDNFPAT